jgi:hypothetical protein
MTKVVHCNKEPYDIYIGRPSKWGNPYTHHADKETLAEHIVESREEAISKYKEYILAKPELLNDLHELEGKTLGCWCMPSDGSFSIPFICHGQVLVELIEKNKLKKFLKKT